MDVRSSERIGRNKMNKIKKIIEKVIFYPLRVSNEEVGYRAIWVWINIDSSSLKDFKEKTKKYKIHTDVLIRIDGETKEFTFEEFKNLLGF